LATLATPARGDVVVFPDPGDPARRLVKRVVGLPGETIELREQVLHVDGVPQPRLELGPFTYLEPGEGDRPPREDTCRRWREQLEAGPSRTAGAAVAGAAGEAPRAGGAGRAHEVLQCRRLRAGRSEGPFGPVRPGHLFVMGDNRDRSADGRAGWEVPVAEVVGRGALIGWSWGPGGWWPGGGAGVRIDRLFKPVE
jgi:signal peptidase I